MPRSDMIPTIPGDALVELALLSRETPEQVWTQGDLSERPFTREWLEVHDNPDWHGEETDDRFLVVVPVSGGLDSLTCMAMATRAGLAIQPVYVDTGAPYSAAEIQTARGLVDCVAPTARLEVVSMKVDYQTLGGYIDLGRNALLGWVLADRIVRDDLWGEVWFGNVGDWQESPVRGGDKSHRFFGTFQHVLSGSGRDVRVVNPLIGHTKVDLVHWWAQRGLVEVAAWSFSCYDTGPKQCGRCRACFKRWVTFGAAGYADELHWPLGLVPREHAAAFWRAVRTDRSPSMATGRWEPVGKFLASVGLGPELGGDR